MTDTIHLHLRDKMKNDSLKSLIVELKFFMQNLQLTEYGEEFLNTTQTEIESRLKQIELFMGKVNKVTAPHRHGNPIPKRALDELSNRQLDIEKILYGDKNID